MGEFRPLLLPLVVAGVYVVAANISISSDNYSEWDSLAHVVVTGYAVFFLFFGEVGTLTGVLAARLRHRRRKTPD